MASPAGNQPATSRILDGVRVIDFSTGPVGGMASTVLSDFGADVIKVEPPEGDRFRTLASSPLWLRGRRSIALDLHLPDGRATAQRLARSADVVLVSGPMQRLEEWSLHAAQLCAQAPRLVHCTMTGWGTTGPLANLPGYEGLVAAKCGRFAGFDVQLNEDRPVFGAVQVATHIAAQSAVQGIAAALFAREHTGLGARVETSLLQSLTPFDLVDALTAQLSDRQGKRFRSLRTLQPMPTLNYHPLRTSDGQWIQCGNLLEHLFYSFLDAIDLLGDLLIDEQFEGSPATWSPEAIEVARDLILVRMQDRTAAEWIAIFEENGNVAAEPILGATEVMDHRDIVDGGCLVRLDDEPFGPSVQIGPIAEFEMTPAIIDTGAPAVGNHTIEVLAELESWEQQTREASRPAHGPTPGRPLDGVTILDLSAIIAGPLAGTMLADLGARVIKVEPYGGDPFRQMLTEGRMAVHMNAGKESICIDLKKAAGQAVLHELVVDADVLVHNFRAGVPEKLGIDWDTLSAINPKLIWAVVNGYGAHGPSALRPATHPVMGAACGGVAWQAGAALTRPCDTLDDVRENARQIMAANEANPDPNTSVVAAASIALALAGRARDGGAGQVVRINMQVANAWANSDIFVKWDGHPGRAPVDEGHHGFHAGYRLYPTADGWVFLAATTDAEFRRLSAVLTDATLTTDDRFASVPSRRSNDAALTALLIAQFATRPAAEWEDVMAAAGVGCVRADGVDQGRFFVEHPHMQTNGWAPLVEHDRFGSIRRWGPTVTVDGLNPSYRSAPLAGQHTDALLTSIGRSGADIAKLRTERVVASEEVTAVD